MRRDKFECANNDKHVGRAMFEIRRRGFTAEFVAVISLIGLILIAMLVILGILITITSCHAKDPTLNPSVLSLTVMVLMVLAIVVPLLATWIGSAVAYAYSSSNFTLALNAAGRIGAPQSATDDRPITDVMIERKQFVESITLDATQSRNDIPIKKLKEMFRPGVTRIPVLNENGAIEYIIHELPAYKFHSKPGRTNATLEDLVNDAELSPWLRRYEVVPSSCTVSDVRKKMAVEPYFQDVFVTPDGRTESPVMGWVTDTRLMERAKF
jgi:hypothetical protein